MLVILIVIQIHLSGFRELNFKAGISICLSVFFYASFIYSYFSAVLSTNQRYRKALQFQSCFLSFSTIEIHLACLPTRHSPAWLWLNRDLHSDPLNIFQDQHMHKDSLPKQSSKYFRKTSFGYLEKLAKTLGKLHTLEPQTIGISALKALLKNSFVVRES